jgi:hypothetical protein
MEHSSQHCAYSLEGAMHFCADYKMRAKSPLSFIAAKSGLAKVEPNPRRIVDIAMWEDSKISQTVVPAL